MSSSHQSVPPARSSHTAEAGADTGRVIRIPRLVHIGVFLLLFCAAFPFFGWPQVMWILFAIPAAAAIWVERTRTTVSAAGLDLQTFFGSRHIDWSQVQGVSIPKRGYVRAHLTDGSEVKLPAVGYDRLRALIEASGGRIPDPFAAAEEAEAAKAEAERAEAERAENVSENTDGESTENTTPATEGPDITEGPAIAEADTEPTSGT
ncbi:hypothetical protein ABIA39_000498 [Nocardia sp. GAS34]